VRAVGKEKLPMALLFCKWAMGGSPWFFLTGKEKINETDQGVFK
jgi:hypothetical protein